MKLRYLTWTVFLLIFVYNAAVSQPKLKIVGGDTYDWQVVYPTDNPLKARIILKNTGDKTLHITNVQPGCSCTTAPLDKKELEPGESVYMDVSLEIKKTDAKLSKIIKIFSNDPVEPVKIIYLKADVVRPIEIMPRPIFIFKDLAVNSSGTDTLTLKNVTKKTITLSDIKVQPKNAVFSLKGKKKIRPGQEIKVMLTYKPEKEGIVKGSVKMKTDNPDMPEIKIFCSGRIKAADKK